MINTLLACVVVLAAITILNLVLCFAIIRKLRDAGSHDGAELDLPATGAQVGDFVARDIDGAAVSTADLAGRSTVVGFVMPGCGPCRSLVDAAREGRISAGTSALFFVRGETPATDEVQYLVDNLRDTARVVLISGELDEVVSGAFGGIVGYPTLVRVDDGVVTAAGRSFDSVGAERREPVLTESLT
ncbi:hypothetical protein DFJ67_5064 [Asanoa ferruginea]|uniref:Thioredoxin domain-containing protein n=1 Tax=Asanoa ferruginea TaxID=53367 RepID=A0A3D9ZNT3_9ACTN|nr:hypothetical protein [Asanoa ferruginea]REF99038.1 hypothetical protein DFJ67_5064 [Asanoa ferruginea]GIF46278.1 hypothetical protein Afe04nite_08170 [Asanoa ferruginea]